MLPASTIPPPRLVVVEVVPGKHSGRAPFDLPSFRSGLDTLRDGTVASWQHWTEQLVQIARLAAQVPRDADDLAWKSFLREVAVARRCSDQAAGKDVYVAVALVQSHPRTLALLRAGRMPQYNAQTLIEEAAGCDPEVARLVDEQLAERACSLTPARIRDAVRKVELLHDPEGAAARSAKAATCRNVRVHGGRDDQSTMVLSGPTLPIVAFYEAITKAARAARAAGDPRGLDALRFDIALDVSIPAGAEADFGSPAPRPPDADVPPQPPVDLLVDDLPPEPHVDPYPEPEPDVDRVPEPPADLVFDDVPPEPVGEPVLPSSDGSALPAWLGDRRRLRPVQVLLHLPVTTALGLTNDPGWLPGHGWISAPQCRQWLTAAELRQVCVDADGTVLDLADRAVRPPPTPQGVRAAVLRMVADPGPVTEKTWRAEPQHDPSPALRAFVEVRDGFCDGPTGTRVPSSRCDDDHDKPFPAGPTAAWNLKSRSGRTHHLKHYGWVPTRLPGRTRWVSPSGQRVEVHDDTDPPPSLPPRPRLPDPDELHARDAERLRDRGPVDDTGWDEDPAV